MSVPDMTPHSETKGMCYIKTLLLVGYGKNVIGVLVAQVEHIMVTSDGIKSFRYFQRAEIY